MDSSSSTNTSSTVLYAVETVDKDKDIEKAVHVEIVQENTNVPRESPGNEKNGLQTNGDNDGHDDGSRMTFSRLMSLISMAILFTGSQIPLFLLGSVQAYISNDIGGSDRATWYILGNLIALAAVCPFVGSLSDLLGRRWVALLGASLLVIGMIVSSTATSMNNFIAGMVISGGGAGINELTAIAVTSEIAPTAKRGKYMAVLMLGLLPFTPSIFYAQFIASQSVHAWRYLGLWCGLWAFLGMVLTFIFFHPAPRPNSVGLSRHDILMQIDWLGGFLSVGGTIMFIMALLWGGYQYTWSSAHVLFTLILGIAMLTGFFAWEMYGAKYPMFPRRLHKAPRTLNLTLLITFISGANFFAVLVFWPIESFNVYGSDPIANGLRSLPTTISLMVGAVIVLVLLSILRGYNRALLIVSSCLMTGATASLAVLNRENVQVAYGLLVVAGLGVGGNIVPASIMTTIVCPDDLIATVTALTLSIRIIGGAIGYSTYYNVLYSKLVPILTTAIANACREIELSDPTTIMEISQALAMSLDEKVLLLVGGNVTKSDILVHSAQVAFSQAYKWVYYVSIPFGMIAVIAACFVEDLSPYIDDHVAIAYK